MFSLNHHGKYKRWYTHDQSQEESYFSKSSRSNSLHLFKTSAIQALIHCTEMKFYYIWHYRWQGKWCILPACCKQLNIQEGRLC